MKGYTQRSRWLQGDECSTPSYASCWQHWGIVDLLVINDCCFWTCIFPATHNVLDGYKETSAQLPPMLVADNIEGLLIFLWSTIVAFGLVFSQSMWALFGSFFPCSLTSTDKIYTTKLVLQIVQFVNPWWNIYRNHIKIRSFTCLVIMVIDECMFVDFLTWYIAPPNYCHYWV